jgi:hypothetical protein
MKRLSLCLAACTALAAALPAHAAGGGVNVGSLSCQVSSGWGFVFGSSRAVNCTYSGPNGKVEHYKGSISKFGVDIGYQQSGVMIWGVFAPTGDVGPGTLAGKYGGGTAGAAVGVGLAANALIGGSTGTISLQPLSIEGMTGLNVAAGIGALSLEAAP